MFDLIRNHFKPPKPKRRRRTKQAMTTDIEKQLNRIEKKLDSIIQDNPQQSQPKQKKKKSKNKNKQESKVRFQRINERK